MLTTFILLPLDVMYSTTRHKRLGRSWITQWISAQLAKVVPKNSEPLFDHFKRRKIEKETRPKQNDANLSWIARKGLGPTYLLSPSRCCCKRLFVSLRSKTIKNIDMNEPRLK